MRFYKKLFQFVVSIVLITILLNWVDFTQLKASLVKADYSLLIVAFFLILFNRLLMPVKWNFLLLAKGVKIGLYEAIKIYFISSFLGLYLPPTIGSDAVRTYYVKRRGFRYSDILSSILVERLLGLITLLLFGIFGCLLFYNLIKDIQFEFSRLFTFAIVAIVCILAVFLLSLNSIFCDFLLKILGKLHKRKYLGKISQLLTKLYSSYIEYNKFKGILFLFFILTCLEVTLPIVRSYIVALSFNVNIPLIYFFAFVPIILLLIRLPLSLDGFGIHEGGFVYFLGLAGISTSDGFAIGLVNHVVFLIGILPGSLFYMTLKSSDRKTIKSGQINNDRSSDTGINENKIGNRK